MRWYMGASTARSWSQLTAPEGQDQPMTRKSGIWATGMPDNKLLWRQQHSHLLPIGFCRLAVMQADRYKKTDIL